MSEFWSACLNRFEQELPAQQFNTWIKGLRLETDAAGPTHFRLVAPNRFVMQWVRERYLAQIEALGLDFFASPININLGVAEAVAESPPVAEDNAETPAITEKLPSPHPQEVATRRMKKLVSMPISPSTPW
jgi:chromosomal replication initiator protein